MKLLLAAAVLLAGCGGLTETEDGVAFLDILPPARTTLEVGETLQLVAVPLDARGEPVEAPVRWVSASDFLAVEEATGLVTALAEGTNGRVQASTGTTPRPLYSDPVTLTVVAAPSAATRLRPPDLPR